MEIGTTIISTKEYMELRAMKDNLEARKAEIEANADKFLVGRFLWDGRLITEPRYLGRDEALNLLQTEISKLERDKSEQKSIIYSLRDKAKKNDPAKISRSLPARLHFLFTGNLTKVKE